ALARSHPCRSHHVDHAGDEAEQKENDETERRRRQQSVKTPATRRPDDNARDQFRGKLKTARHCRCSGGAVFAFNSRLISLGFAVVTKFGQALIETSEP